MTGSPEEMHIKCLGNVTENSREHHLRAFEHHYQQLTKKREWGGMENVLDLHIYRNNLPSTYCGPGTVPGMGVNW